MELDSKDFSVKVGVIIPMFGVAEYLRECLDSVISQSYKNLSVLLVSDGDKSCLDIALEYARMDERFIVIDKENGGQSTGRNVGMDFYSNIYEMIESKDSTQDLEYKDLLTYKVANKNPYNIKEIYVNRNYNCGGGKSHNSATNTASKNLQIPKINYIIFLDSDDYWLSDLVEKCINIFHKLKAQQINAQFIWFGWECIFDGVKYSPYWDFHNRFYFLKSGLFTSLEILQRAVDSKEFVFPIAVQALIDFSFLQEINLRYENKLYAEDHLFGIKLLVQSDYVYVLKDKPYIYRIRPNSSRNYEGNKKMTKETIVPYLLDMYKAFNEDIIYTRTYYKVSSWFIIFKKALEFLNEYETSEDSIKMQKIKLAKSFLHHIANESIPIGDYPEDPLNLIHELAIIKPYISKTPELKKFRKLAIYKPKLYNFLKPIVIKYRNYREKKRRR